MRLEDQGRRDGARRFRAGRSGARRAVAAAALVAICMSVAAPTSASAQPGAPTKAPPAAKRVCVKYRVVQTSAGPSARCVAHRIEVLDQGMNSGVRSGAGADLGSPAPGGGHPSEAPQGGSPQGRTGDATGSHAVAPTRYGAPADQERPSVDGGSTSGGGGDETLVLAIIAACGVAALLVGLMRRPLLRLVGGSRG